MPRRRNWWCLTGFVQTASACWDLTGELNLFGKVIFFQLGGRRIIGIALRTISVLQISISPPTSSAHTSGIPLIRRRSLGGSCITSVLSLCSAASPEIGLDTMDGLSFAETQFATPWSGRSLVRFPMIAQMKLLCRCSVFGSTQMI